MVKRQKPESKPAYSEKEIRSRIQYIFYHEDKIRDAVNTIRNRSLKSSLSGIKVFSGESRPTENQALFNIIPLFAVRLEDGFILTHPEQWLEVASLTWRSVPPDLFEIARLKFAGLSIGEVIRYCNISRSTYNRRMIDFENIAFEFSKKIFD